MGYMIDTTHMYVANIPTSAQRVAGYTTGTADV